MSHRMRGLVTVFTLALAAACSPPEPDTFSPITSRAQLDAHLTDPAPSPLDCLDAEARALFVEGLNFGERGLGGYRYAYLSDLAPEEKAAILALFETNTTALPPTCGPGGARDLSPPSELAVALIAYRAESATLAADLDASEAEGEALARLRIHVPVESAELMVAVAGPWTRRDYLSDLATAGAPADELETLFSTLLSGGAAREAEAVQLHRAYVNRRDFEAAEAFRLAHPGFDIPTVTAPDAIPMQADARRVLVLSEEGGLDELAVTPADYDILVFSSPRCGFCRLAQEDIAADPELLSSLESRSLWVSHPQELPDDPGQVWWSEYTPQLAHHVAYRRDDWPEAGRWATPTFLLMEDGAVADRITGWPRQQTQTNIDSLRRHLGL